MVLWEDAIVEGLALMSFVDGWATSWVVLGGNVPIFARPGRRED